MRALALLVVTACAVPDASLAPGFDLQNADDADDTGPLGSRAEQDDAGLRACDARVAWMLPTDGATEAPLGGVVRVGFTEPIGEGAWALVLAGVPGRAELAGDGLGATFTPDVELAPERAYTALAQACGEDVETSFTTSGPRVSEAALAGRRWAVDLGAGAWLAPRVADVFGPFLDLGDVKLVASLDPGGAVALHAWTALVGAAPEACEDAFDLGPLDLSDNPRFRTAPPRSAPGPDTPRLVDDLRVEGVFADGGATIHDVSVHARLHVGALERVTGLRGLCATAARLGDRCLPCSDGAASCLEAVISGLEARPDPASVGAAPACASEDVVF